MTPIAITTLKEFCQTHKLNYHELTVPQPPKPLVQLQLNQGLAHGLGTPLVYTASLEDVEFFGHSYVKLPDGSYCWENQSFQDDLTRNGFDSYLQAYEELPSGPTYHQHGIWLGGTWAPAPAGAAAHNFGHFTFEFLSRLAAVEQVYTTTGARSCPLFVYDNLPDTWLEFIKLLGYSVELVSPYRRNKFLRVITAACPYRRTSQNHFSFWSTASQWLRARLTQGLAATPQNLIYLVRGAGARGRLIQNDLELQDLLTKYGFACLDLSQYSAEKQVSLVASAKVIVTPVGAGQIATSWAPDGSKVLLLAPPKIGTGFWGGLIQGMNHRQTYHRFEGYYEEPFEALITRNPFERPSVYGQDEGRDFKVNLPAFESVLRQALKD